MQPTTEILARISKNSKTSKEEVFTRLYRYLLRPDLYYVAYKKLYANKGAATKGVTHDTADGFSAEKIEKIIQSLCDETYQPSPARRTYIEKRNRNGKKRPLGIPTFTDKLVQEVLRMVLEAVYEPIFLECSHGFRPKRSCHTALNGIKRGFNGTRWFVEGDIKGCFDTIDHGTLVGLMNTKIKDARLIKLIYKFLKAGYMESWQYHKTYSGTPQGGIISPILANIYLHELDKFVMKLKTEFDKPEPHGTCTPEYVRVRREMEKVGKQIKKSEGVERQQLIEQYRQLKAQKLKTPSKSQTDKKLKYIRYADDFLIGVNGSHEDCLWIKSELSRFIGQSLKMELSDEKTLITHSNEVARFLGYDVRIRRSSKIKQCGGELRQYTKRAWSNTVELTVPFADKIHTFLFEKGVVCQGQGRLWPIKRHSLLNLTDLEIISIYNAELRGICNYYNMASNFGKLAYFAYLMEYSCLKTFAAKYKCSTKKVIAKFQDGSGKWGIPYETKTGMKRGYFAKWQNCKEIEGASDIKAKALAVFAQSVTTFEARLKAKTCEVCGTTESKRFEIHHVNKLKNLKGKQPWERIMIAKRRKTMVVCKNCHLNIHRH